jgi:tungstate transport system ATP-binding protein
MRPEWNAFPSTVEKITPMGPYQKVQLNCGFPLVTYVTSHALSALSVKPGTQVLASFGTAAVHAVKKELSAHP